MFLFIYTVNFYFRIKYVLDIHVYVHLHCYFYFRIKYILDIHVYVHLNYLMVISWKEKLMTEN